MKNLLFAALVTFAAISSANAQTREYQIITTIESVVPGGLGRSRMISANTDGSVKEEKMENFFSLVGINFKNVKENDAMVARKLNQMAQEGWKLENTIPGVYSAEQTTGIFIIRYIFSREAK